MALRLGDRESAQCRLIGKLTVDRGFGRSGGSVQVIEVRQNLGRNEAERSLPRRIQEPVLCTVLCTIRGGTA